MLITEIELKGVTGIRQLPTLKTWCDKQMLPYMVTPQGLLTTVDAFNTVLAKIGENKCPAPEKPVARLDLMRCRQR